MERPAAARSTPERGDFLETRVGGQQESRPAIGTPIARVGHIEPQLLAGIVRHHACISRQHGLDVQFAHALHDFLLQRLALGIPVVGIGSAPAFQIVHQPPGLEARTGHKAVHLVLAAAQAGQHVAPHHVGPHRHQRQVDAVQGHPVDFALPAVPVPEGHRVGKGAVVQVVAILCLRFLVHLFPDGRQHFGQVGLHAVPRKMHAGIIFEIPVHSRGDVHIRIAAHHHLVALLVQFEEIDCRLLPFHNKLARSALVDALQQSVQGRGQCRHSGHDTPKAKHPDSFHHLSSILLFTFFLKIPNGNLHSLKHRHSPTRGIPAPGSFPLCPNFLHYILSKPDYVFHSK